MRPLYNCLFERLRRHARPQNSHTGCMLKLLRAVVPSIHLKNPDYSQVS